LSLNFGRLGLAAPPIPDMIQEFQNAAHNDLKLLRAVLERIDMKHGHGR
jgi:hypothetical protein